MQTRFLRRAFRILLFVVAPLASLCATTPLPAHKLPPNVILITIDTVRADHLGCYGAKDIKTPTLDALAHDGIVFERAISQVPLTWPSHAAILTGLYPFQNGVQDFNGQPLDPRFRSVAQAFQRNGYATGAVVSAFVLDRSWGLARGFTFYDDAFAPEAFMNRDLGLVDRRAGDSVTRAIAWLNKNSRRPFFFWLHLYDPHSPYDPPEPYRTEYHGHLYDGEIAYADHELGRLIAWLKQNQVYSKSMIVFLSDHGESLGEHGEHEHGFFTYNATVHIPLIVKPPSGQGFRPGRVSRAVETTAVAPTLFKLSGIKDEIEKQFQSHPLLGSSMTGEDEAYSETFYPFSSFGWSPLHALETSRYHYIDAPEPELYDLAADPDEKNNVVGQQAATAAVLKDKLQILLRTRPFAPATNESSKLSPDAADKLRALGYFAYRSPVSAEALTSGLPDPKTKLGEFNSILEAEDAFQQREDDHAEAILNRIQEQDPSLYVIPFLLGESAVRRQNWAEAVDYLQRCLKLNPNFDSAMTGFARALSKVDRADEAKSWLQRAVQSNPQNYRAWYEAGLLAAPSNADAALADYQQATSVQPNFFPGQRDLGLALFNRKDYAAAAIHLEKALALGVDDAKLHNFLGICYSQVHQLSKAVREHARAIALEPSLAEAHLNLAYDYQLQHQTNAARKQYQLACKLDSGFCKFVPAQ